MIILKILDTPPGTKFDQQIESYSKYMEKEVLRFPELINEIKKLDKSIDYFNSYSIYMKWAIRKLEYSFIIDNLPGKECLKILDVGCGVTIFPNILSKMGHTVDALDPAEEWKLANSDISRLYNDFFHSNVNYINDYVYGINTKELYDVVISVSVLEHLPLSELKKTISKLLSLLKPDGSLIMTIDYSPRAVHSKNKLFNNLLQKFRTIFGLQAEPTSGFNYHDFNSLIYQNLPCRGDLNELWKQDRKATSYRDFWLSHSFKNCLYEEYRPYLALGICCIKQKKENNV